MAVVSSELGITKEAFCNAVAYLDRLGSLMALNKNNYQHIGLTCLLLSHKLDSRTKVPLEIASSLVEDSLSPQGFQAY